MSQHVVATKVYSVGKIFANAVIADDKGIFAARIQKILGRITNSYLGADGLFREYRPINPVPAPENWRELTLVALGLKDLALIYGVREAKFAFQATSYQGVAVFEHCGKMYLARGVENQTESEIQFRIFSSWQEMEHQMPITLMPHWLNDKLKKGLGQKSAGYRNGNTGQYNLAMLRGAGCDDAMLAKLIEISVVNQYFLPEITRRYAIVRGWLK